MTRFGATIVLLAAIGAVAGITIVGMARLVGLPIPAAAAIGGCLASVITSICYAQAMLAVFESSGRDHDRTRGAQRPRG